MDTFTPGMSTMVCIRESVDESIGVILLVTFTPDGETIALARHPSNSHHGGIILWDISNPDDITSPTTVVDTQDGTVYSLQYSGQFLASGAINSTIRRLWNAADNSCTILMTGNKTEGYRIFGSIHRETMFHHH